jgi:lipoyl(octanoyl) transferase
MTKQSTYRKCEIVDLGLVSYKETWDLQKDTLQRRLKGELPDTFYLLEHPHTYTLGKTADGKNLLFNKSELEKKGITVFEIDRGGDITYHGPGQIVGYPIINLKEWKLDTHLYLRSLEEVLIRTCNDYGLDAGRAEGLTGVWIDNRKIAAIGIKISRWITMHGFAFNVNTNLDLFQGIIPCGITDKKVTSLKEELGNEHSLTEVHEKILKHFKDIFEYDEIIAKKKDSLSVSI